MNLSTLTETSYFVQAQPVAHSAAFSVLPSDKPLTVPEPPPLLSDLRSLHRRQFEETLAENQQRLKVGTAPFLAH